MVRILLEFFRRISQQLLFNLDHSFPRCNASPVSKPENMGINGNCRVTKGCIEHDICSFPADTGQSLQMFTVIGYLTTMPGEQKMAGGDDVLRFGSVQADCLDVFNQTFNAQSSHFFRGWRYGK